MYMSSNYCEKNGSHQFDYKLKISYELKEYEENRLGVRFGFVNHLAPCVFHILREAGAERKASISGPLTLPYS